MATEVSFAIDWGVWIPIGIAAVSLALTVYQMRKKGTKDNMVSLESTIDRAHSALKECEVNLKQCGREKDELRRENIALQAQVAKLVMQDADGN